MFSKILKVGFINKIQLKAYEEIKKDRDRYKKLWDKIDDYCITNELIVSDVAKIVGKSDTIKAIYDKQYKIYTANPFRHANNIANLLHQLVKGDPMQFTVKLKTVKEQEEFLIEYDTRAIVTIYLLQKHRSVELNAIITPIKIDKILYMPAEIELIDVYHKLYDPFFQPDYETYRDFEDLLFTQVLKRRESGIIGGGLRHDCREKKKELLEGIKISLVKDWLPTQKKTVLIGPWAYDWINNSKELCANIEKIQLISEMDHNDLLTKLLQYVNQITKATITVREQELHIPKDFLINRYTYYMQIKTEKGITEKPFLDLFNCAQFEVIPYYIKDDICIGVKWVMLRFLFIDLWIVRLIKKLGLLTEDILTKKIKYIWQLVDKFRGDFDADTIEYIGTYYDYNISKKISNIQGKMFLPYFPEMYIREHNTYRII